MVDSLLKYGKSYQSGQNLTGKHMGDLLKKDAENHKKYKDYKARLEALDELKDELETVSLGMDANEDVEFSEEYPEIENKLYEVTNMVREEIKKINETLGR
jgi:hypothetical protein